MKLTQAFATLMLIGSSLAAAMPNPFDGVEARALCRKPFCEAKCPDGFPYDCCVTYIQDPCTGHYCKSKTDFECLCKCPNGNGSFLCNVQYIRDPCAILSDVVA